MNKNSIETLLRLCNIREINPTSFATISEFFKDLCIESNYTSIDPSKNSKGIRNMTDSNMLLKILDIKDLTQTGRIDFTKQNKQLSFSLGMITNNTTISAFEYEKLSCLNNLERFNLGEMFFAIKQDTLIRSNCLFLTDEKTRLFDLSTDIDELIDYLK